MQIMNLTKPHFIILVFVILPNGLLHARDSQPFSSLEVGLRYAVNVNRNRFHDFYASGRGAEGAIRTPFYYGNMQVAIQALFYAAKDADRAQDFRAIVAYISWDRESRLPYRVRWSTGFGAGFHAFLPGNQSLLNPSAFAHFTETELSANLFTRLNYPVTEDWTIDAKVSFDRIFTFRPITLVYLSFGVGYAFSTPMGLRTFLE
jgi:hypothetical protein